VALVMAAVGIYGVMSYSISRRTHEIGIRVSLGASRSEILLLVVRQALFLALPAPQLASWARCCWRD
jgi:putative ABC transport system permease protein